MPINQRLVHIMYGILPCQSLRWMRKCCLLSVHIRVLPVLMRAGPWKTWVILCPSKVAARHAVWVAASWAHNIYKQIIIEQNRSAGFVSLMDIYFGFRMKPEPRLRISWTQIDPYAEPSKYIVMFEKKAKSDQKLGKSKKRMAERKKVLRAEAAKNETEADKKRQERKGGWEEKDLEKEGDGEK